MQKCVLTLTYEIVFLTVYWTFRLDLNKNVCIYVLAYFVSSVIFDPPGFYGKKRLNFIQRLKLSKNMHFDADADIYDQNSDACNVNQ